MVGKLALKGVGSFALSPSQDAPLLAACVPEAKGCPGFAGVWPLAALAAAAKAGESPTPVARRSFFRVGACRLVHGLSFCPLAPRPVYTGTCACQTMGWGYSWGSS